MALIWQVAKITKVDIELFKHLLHWDGMRCLVRESNKLAVAHKNGTSDIRESNSKYKSIFVQSLLNLFLLILEKCLNFNTFSRQNVEILPKRNHCVVLAVPNEQSIFLKGTFKRDKPSIYIFFFKFTSINAWLVSVIYGLPESSSYADKVTSHVGDNFFENWSLPIYTKATVFGFCWTCNLSNKVIDMLFFPFSAHNSLLWNYSGCAKGEIFVYWNGLCTAWILWR